MPACAGQTLQGLEEPLPAASTTKGAAAEPPGTHLAHAPHDAELLRVDEALQHHPDGHVDVVLHHVIPQVHAGVSLGHPDHGLDVPHRDGDAAGRLRRGRKEQLLTEG